MAIPPSELEKARSVFPDGARGLKEGILGGKRPTPERLEQLGITEAHLYSCPPTRIKNITPNLEDGVPSWSIELENGWTINLAGFDVHLTARQLNTGDDIVFLPSRFVLEDKEHLGPDLDVIVRNKYGQLYSFAIGTALVDRGINEDFMPIAFEETDSFERLADLLGLQKISESKPRP